MKKKEMIVGIIPEKKKNISSAPKKSRTFWRIFTEEYFIFCEDKFGEKPTFDGSAPRDLGMVYDAIEKKCVEKEIEWTEEIAHRSIKIFLQVAWNNNKWLQENFMLYNLNRQKDNIFRQIKQLTKNGQSNSGVAAKTNIVNHKTAGQEFFADRLKGRIQKLK